MIHEEILIPLQSETTNDPGTSELPDLGFPFVSHYHSDLGCARPGDALQISWGLTLQRHILLQSCTERSKMQHHLKHRFLIGTFSFFLPDQRAFP